MTRPGTELVSSVKRKGTECIPEIVSPLHEGREEIKVGGWERVIGTARADQKKENKRQCIREEGTMRPSQSRTEKIEIQRWRCLSHSSRGEKKDKSRGKRRKALFPLTGKEQLVEGLKGRQLQRKSIAHAEKILRSPREEITRHLRGGRRVGELRSPSNLSKRGTLLKTRIRFGPNLHLPQQWVDEELRRLQKGPSWGKAAGNRRQGDNRLDEHLPPKIEMGKGNGHGKKLCLFYIAEGRKRAFYSETHDELQREGEGTTSKKRMRNQDGRLPISSQKGCLERKGVRSRLENKGKRIRQHAVFYARTTTKRAL